MRKSIKIFTNVFAVLVANSAMATSTSPRATSQYIKRDTYNYMYPYMNNQMRTDLNPGLTTSQSTNPMDVVVKTKPLANTTSSRRVVPRNNSSTARAATNNQNSAPRITTPSAQTTNRRVVARRATTTSQPMVSRGNTRLNSSYVKRSDTATVDVSTPVSSARCMADYTECMNMYCLREDTAYNRCYCSAKLSQIDAQYQPTIEKLITQILTIQSTNQWSSEDMNEYWMSTVGQYTGGTNSWTTLDDALNIDWAGLESTVRGQNAFTTGHQYCVQHLNNCNYMASNLRDAYRSEIARDCAIYEQSLQRIKTAAESIVEQYND